MLLNGSFRTQGRIDTLKVSGTTIAKYKYIGSRVAQRNYRDTIYYEPIYDNLGRITSADSGTGYAKFDYEYDPNTNNIGRQIYDHRTNPTDPCTDFGYDNLDRLTVAEYGIDDSNEAFTIDDLGSRENVNVRDGNDITYTVDDLTNRYTSIEDVNLTYDAAGNLTKDKDGYEYEYDYENRIIKITRDPNDTVVAEFAYDALGRRIEKKDLIDPSNTRRYHYNYNWQVLVEYNGEGFVKGWFVYGNYIDEVLAKGTTPFPTSARFYIHDHLYSPAALTNFWGTVLERYEYDAYGNPTIWNADFTTERDSSNYGNPYLFTGRRVDFLDCVNLLLQYNRNRYYDYYTSRWLTQDKEGYVDGMNLYEYVQSNPIVHNDPMGLSVGALVKQLAITRLKKLDDKHAGYDYYTELTGLKPLLFDKLVPALEWLDDNDYFWVTKPVKWLARYKPWPVCNLEMTPSADRETMFHEAIHVYNDMTPGIMSARKDEGIAHAGQEMEDDATRFQYIEDELKKDTPSIEFMRIRWRGAWRAINLIVGSWAKYDSLISGEVYFTLEESDVSNVDKYLDFELKCDKIAEHYNNILKTKSNWRKERCPHFMCTTIPLVNITGFNLETELYSVFK